MSKYLWKEKEVPAHTACALWVTKNAKCVHANHPVPLGKKCVEMIEATLDLEECMVCHQTVGYLIKCCEKSCEFKFHVFCAVKNSFFVDVDPQTTLTGKIHCEYFCGKHSVGKKSKDDKTIWYRTKEYISSIFHKQISKAAFPLLYNHWIDLRLRAHKKCGAIPIIPLLRVLQQDNRAVDNDIINGVGMAAFLDAAANNEGPSILQKSKDLSFVPGTGKEYFLVK